MADPLIGNGEAEDAGPAARLFRLRGVAVIELFLFFAVAFLIDWLTGGGFDRFAGAEPHPYWIAVLLLSVQYGTNEGLLAALAASAALRVGNLPAQTIDQDLYQYLLMVSHEPLMWMVAAVLIGEVRMRQIREREHLRDGLTRARAESEAITRSYQQLKTVKENLETRVAGQMRTVSTLYRAARSVDRLDEGEVLLGVSELIRTVMNPEKSSLFLLNGALLESVTNEGWTDEDNYARWFDSSKPLFETVVGRQHFPCVAHTEDERVLDGEGVLAGPLIAADSGEIVGMIKIESLGFMDLNVSTIETFRILCEWVGTALAKAHRFRLVKEQQLYAEDGALFSSNFIGQQGEFLARLGRRLGFETTAITIRPIGIGRLSAEARADLAAAISTGVHRSLRNTDLACEYGSQGTSYGVVLPATPLEQAHVVARKLETAVREELPAELAHIAIDFVAEKVEAE